MIENLSCDRPRHGSVASQRVSGSGSFFFATAQHSSPPCFDVRTKHALTFASVGNFCAPLDPSWARDRVRSQAASILASARPPRDQHLEPNRRSGITNKTKCLYANHKHSVLTVSLFGC